MCGAALILRIIHEWRWNIYTFYGSAKIFQIFFESAVAALQMTEPCELGFAFGHEPRRDKRRSAAQVFGLQLRAMQAGKFVRATCKDGKDLL